jgi:orotidine-5'-phosphate decarboxylase
MAELVVALDVASAADALRLHDRLRGVVPWYKVGSVLFVAEGPGVVRELLARGAQVFLDLKWHDIPNTVAGAVEAAADLGVTLATVHLAGGPAMHRAASRAAAGRLRLVGVGVLTSLDREAYAAIVGRPVGDLGDELTRLARAGLDAGLDGVVSSPAELRRLRASLGARTLLVAPGIRGTGDPAGDQARTATAREAVADGADLVVVGRPVTGAADPRAAAAALREEMA